MAIAADVGLDDQRLRRDMENPAIEEYLDETIRLARTLGINGTPAFVIGDTLVPGAVESYCQKLVTVVFRRRVRSAFLRL